MVHEYLAPFQSGFISVCVLFLKPMISLSVVFRSSFNDRRYKSVTRVIMELFLSFVNIFQRKLGIKRHEETIQRNVEENSNRQQAQSIEK